MKRCGSNQRNPVNLNCLGGQEHFWRRRRAERRLAILLEDHVGVEATGMGEMEVS